MIRLLVAVPFALFAAPASANGCAAHADARSTGYERPVAIRITNRANGPRAVQWIDYEGRARDYVTLAPGETFEQQTFATHPWRIVDAAGACVAIFVTEPNSRDFTIQDATMREDAPAERQNARAQEAEARYGPGATFELPEYSENAVDVAGRAMGGRVRAEPSTDAAVTARLREGEAVRITLATPSWLNGYYWYRVEREGRDLGYVWGGILCAPGSDLPGTFRCE